MEIYLATENTHKVRELKAIFADHRIITPKEAGIDYSFEETGTTYFENAYGKARALFDKVQAPVIADDSGLSLPALDGAPGIYSSRYGSPGDGQKLETPERNRYLLSKTAHLQKEEDREAFFVSCMVLILEDYRFFTAQETVDGVLTTEPRGGGGFGYDPLFFLPSYGRTVAELPEEEKNRISHRGKAGARLASLLAGMDTESLSALPETGRFDGSSADTPINDSAAKNINKGERSS
ncbi:MAG: RdgB/HAM1 family non-canonical purine NTP pyrophosphatase [Spirochaetia bacterium]